MKKRALAILLALCIAAVNTTGAFAAATEGTEQQTAEEVTGAGESAEEAQEAEAAETVKEPEEADTDAAPAHTEKEQPEEDKADGAATAQAAEGTAAPDGEEQEIMKCLIADSGCEMYPLTGGAEKPAGGSLPFYISGNGNDWDVHLDGYLEISLKPAECFADPDSGRYAIDTAKIQSMLGVSAAASKAAENDARTGSRGTNRAGTCPSETK